MKLVKGIRGRRRARWTQSLFFLKSSISVPDILYRIYMIFPPVLENAVRVFKTVLVRGNRTAFAGFQDDIRCESVFLKPFLNIGRADMK